MFGRWQISIYVCVFEVTIPTIHQILPSFLKNCNFLPKKTKRKKRTYVRRRRRNNPGIFKDIWFTSSSSSLHLLLGTILSSS
jgi:hypothetical protein